jgi:hypothetical protein
LRDIVDRMEQNDITLYCIGCKPDVSALKDFLSEIVCKRDKSFEDDYISLCDPVSLAQAQALIEQSEENFEEQEVVEYIVTTVHDISQSNQETGPRLINQMSECRIKPKNTHDGLLN